jgi:hypothetical protein
MSHFEEEMASLPVEVRDVVYGKLGCGSYTMLARHTAQELRDGGVAEEWISRLADYVVPDPHNLSQEVAVAAAAIKDEVAAIIIADYEHRFRRYHPEIAAQMGPPTHRGKLPLPITVNNIPLVFAQLRNCEWHGAVLFRSGILVELKLGARQ